MPSKLESLFKKTTGVSPTAFEPQLSTEEMQVMIRRAKMAQLPEKPTEPAETPLQFNTQPLFYTLLEQRYGRVGYEEPYVIIGRKLPDGSRQTAILEGVLRSDEEAAMVAPNIKPYEWEPYEEKDEWTVEQPVPARKEMFRGLLRTAEETLHLPASETIYRHDDSVL